MTQSLTGSWTKEITAGYAPPASEEAGIRYPCAPTSLEKCISELNRDIEASRQLAKEYPEVFSNV